MSFPNDRTYSFDANLQFSDGAAALTATGFLLNGGSNGIIDFGGNPEHVAETAGPHRRGRA